MCAAEAAPLFTRALDGLSAGPAEAVLDDLIAAGDTVLAEYTARDGGGRDGRRQAIVSFDGGEVTSWRDHGDVPTRTSGSGPTR